MSALSWMRRSNEKPPRLLAYRCAPWAIVTTASFAIFTDVFLYGVIVPVLPFAITSRAGIPQDRVQFWISILLAAYGAALLITSPLCGYFADRYSNRKVPMLLGLIGLAGATAFFCVSKTIALLVIGRILQGVSSAISWTVGSALVVDTVDKDSIGSSLGWVGLAMSLGFMLSPLLGGIVYDKGGYYQVFAMCFGLIALDTVLRLAIVEVKVARKWQHRDEAQFSSPDTSPVKAFDDTKGVTEKTQGLTPTEPLNSDTTSMVSPKKSPIPRVVQLLCSPRLLATLWGTIMHATVLTAIDTTLPLFVKETFHWTSLGAGLIFLPFIIPSFFGPLIGAACDRYGAKWFASAGFLLATPFLVCFRFVQHDTIAHKVMLCGLLFGVGISEAMSGAPLMAEIMWMVEAEGERRFGKGHADVQGVCGQAYGLFNMAWSTGAILGPILGGFIRDAADWGTVGWSLAILTAFSAVTQVVWVGGPLWGPKESGPDSEPETFTEVVYGGDKALAQPV